MPRGIYNRKGIKRGQYKGPQEYRSKFKEWQEFEAARGSEFREPYKDRSYGGFKHEYKMQKEQAKEYSKKHGVEASPLDWMEDRAINRFSQRTFDSLNETMFKGELQDFMDLFNIDRTKHTANDLFKEIFDIDPEFFDDIKRDYAEMRKAGKTPKEASRVIAEFYFGS